MTVALPFYLNVYFKELGAKTERNNNLVVMLAYSK